MIDQRFIEDLAQDLVIAREPEPVPEMQLASANTGVTTDGGAFVGTRLNMPKGLNTRENQAKQSVLIADTLAGAGKGAVQGFVGLPGDLESIGRMALGYLGYNVDENTALPTSEEIGKRLESVLGPVIPPNQTTGVPTEERERAAEGGELGGEIVAPGGQIKLAKKVIKATKDLPVGMSIKMLDGTDEVIEQAPKTSTKAFKDWFGKSKAVDTDGKPVVLYHGTDQSFDTFEGTSWFTTSKSDASNYSNIITPGKEHTPNVMPVYISIKKPKYLENYANRDEVQKAKASGKYDGVIVKSVMGSNKSYFITFKPEQVKSVFNEGTFDPKNPSILKGVGVGGTGAAMSQEENK
jgi:hypothetical protein